MLYDDKRVCFPQGWFVLVQSKEKQRTTLNRKKSLFEVKQNVISDWANWFPPNHSIIEQRQTREEEKKWRRQNLKKKEIITILLPLPPPHMFRKKKSFLFQYIGSSYNDQWEPNTRWLMGI